MFAIVVSKEKLRPGTRCTRQYRKRGADSLFHGVYNSKTQDRQRAGKGM